jgi:hypothetical protein
MTYITGIRNIKAARSSAATLTISAMHRKSGCWRDHRRTWPGIDVTADARRSPIRTDTVAYDWCAATGPVGERGYGAFWVIFPVNGGCGGDGGTFGRAIGVLH